MKFFNLPKKPIVSENEKLKMYELQTYKEINKIISKIPRSRRDTFLDRLTGNIFNPKQLTKEEKEILLEKYDNREYEFILNIKKELEKELKRKEEIKKNFIKKDEDIEINNQEEEISEDIIETDDQEEEISEDDWLNTYDTEDTVKEDDDDNIPVNNWEKNEFFCEKCMKSFEITEEEKNKIDNGEIRTIICKNCGKELQTETYLEDEDIVEETNDQEEVQINEEDVSEDVEETDDQEEASEDEIYKNEDE